METAESLSSDGAVMSRRNRLLWTLILSTGNGGRESWDSRSTVVVGGVTLMLELPPPRESRCSFCSSDDPSKFDPRNPELGAVGVESSVRSSAEERKVQSTIVNAEPL